MSKLSKSKKQKPALPLPPLTHEICKANPAELKPHPRNYRTHPEDQLAHIIQSIREHGIYRNIVVARDNVILAGHGVVEAARQMGMRELPIVRLDISHEDSRALKLLAGDNEIGNLGIVDDRQLTELLKSLHDIDLDAGLLGTGFDDAMLANLVMVTRSIGEIKDFDEAAEWVGMPEYVQADRRPKLVLSFPSVEHRARFLSKLKLTDEYVQGKGSTISARWPREPRNKWTDVLFKDVNKRDGS